MNDVECAKMQKDIDNVVGDVTELRSDLAPLRSKQYQTHEVVMSMKNDLKMILELLQGSDRHGDIGLMRRVEALEHNTITKGAVVAVAAFIASIAGASAGIIALATHLMLK